MKKRNTRLTQTAALALAALLLLPAAPLRAEGSITAEPLSEETITPLSLSVSYASDYREAGESRWVHYQVPQIALDSEGFPELAAALADYSERGLARAIATADMYEEWIADDDSELARTEGYFTESTLTVPRADSVVTSLWETESGYAGGAHPDYYYDTANFDSATGEKLSLTDVLQDPDSLPETLEQELLYQYGEDAFLVEDLAGAIREEMTDQGTSYEDPATGETIPIEPGPLFTLGYDSITFWFSPYELTSYATGGVQVTLPFSQFPGLVKEEYTRAAQNYITPLPMNTPLRVPMDASTVSWEAIPQDEYDSEWSYEITVDGVTRRQTVYAYRFESWLMHVGSHSFIVSQMLSDNDYRFLFVTDISGLYGLSDPEEIPAPAEIYRSFDSACPTDPEQVRLVNHVDLLSTYQASRLYRFDETGIPIPLENWDTIEDFSNEFFEMALITKRELEADTVEESTGNLTGTITIPAGEKLRFLRTDSESWVDMTLADGTIVRLYVETEWPPQVNGVDAESVFDGMMFAG